MNNLGFLADKQGDHAQAAALHRESLVLEWDVGDRRGVAYRLEGLASVAAARERPARAARLAGAAALREAIGAPRAASERPELDRVVARARGAMDEQAFAAEWAAGRALQPEDAVTEALAVTGLTTQ